MKPSGHAARHRGLQALAALMLPVSLAAAYWHSFAAMWRRWFPAWGRHDLDLYQRIAAGESYYSHGPLTALVAVLIAIVLLRRSRIAVRPRPRLGGAVLGLSLMLHLLGSMAGVTFLSGLSLLGALAGLVLLLWGGRALRRLWFPLATLGLMIPLPEVTIANLSFHLKMLAADWGVRLAGLFGVIAVRSGNEAYLQGGKHLVIANVCNGLRTLISLVAFAALYAYVCRLRGLWRGLLFAMALPVAAASNSLRIASLILAADRFGVQATTGWFHDLSGLMLFAVALGMMFGLEKLMLQARRLGRTRPTQPPREGGPRIQSLAGQWAAIKNAWTGRRGAAAAATLLAAAAGAWLLNRTTSSPRQPRLSDEALPRQLLVNGQKLRGYDLVLDKPTRTTLGTPLYLCRRYAAPAGGQAPLDFCLIFSRDSRKGIRPPELCLEGGGRNIITKAEVTVPGPADAGRIPCREFIVQTGSRRQYVLYTYKRGRKLTHSFWRQQVATLADALLSRDSAGMLIRVSTPIPPGESSRARENASAMLQAAVTQLNRAPT